MNQIDLSNQYDVLKNLDMTTQRCFVIHSNRASYDKSVLAFGIPEGDPTYWPDTAVGIRNNAGVMEFRHAGEGWQIMGNGGSGGSSHQQNTDTGTTSTSFVINDSTNLFGDPSAIESVLVMGSALIGSTLFNSAIGIRNNHGVMEYRNAGFNWAPIGTGTSVPTHVQNTDIGTDSIFFTLNRLNLPFVTTLAFNEVTVGVDKVEYSIGIRNFHGTMEYRNDGGLWTPIGSAVIPPPPAIDTIQFITRAEYIHPFLV